MNFILPSDKDLNEKSRKEKIEVAQKVGRMMSADLSNADRMVVEGLASQLVRDSSLMVRKAFVSEFKNVSFVPEGIAETLSNDLKEVSVPFLLDTENLNQDMLEYIAQNCSEMAREILALRLNLPEPISYVISEKGGEVAATNLMNNQTAEISTRVCMTLTDRFANNDNVLDSMAERNDLPIAAIEVLVTKLSEHLVSALVNKYSLGRDFAAYVGGVSQFKIMKDVMIKASETELDDYLKEQSSKGDLEGPVVFQMLKSGSFRAFCCSIALRANMTKNDVERLLQDGSPDAFQLMLERADLNDQLATLYSSTYFEAKFEEGSKEIL